MFTDAYDWVVEPNVLAMGTYAVGEVMTTKPYVSGTPYIKKMGDYCGDCSLHSKNHVQFLICTGISYKKIRTTSEEITEWQCRCVLLQSAHSKQKILQKKSHIMQQKAKS